MGKVILISVDGMRPDAVEQCGNPFVNKLKRVSTYTLQAQTVFPSVTLPCHMSMFHSVKPERHGILSNNFVPQVRSVAGLFEQASRYGKTCAMLYGWEPLRDISRPSSLQHAVYLNAYSDENTDALLTTEALRLIGQYAPDLVFLYLVETDEKGGHDNGWMSQAYLDRVANAFTQVERVYEKIQSSYSLIVTADHGGHDRMHGTDLPEDKTIPMFFTGPSFASQKEIAGLSILDLAPTAAHVLGIAPATEWEGRIIDGQD